MEDDDKIIMRSREEDILNKLNIIRGNIFYYVIEVGVNNENEKNTGKLQ